MKPINRLQKIKLGTEINLPCLPIKIARVMEVIKNITEEETTAGVLTRARIQMILTTLMRRKLEPGPYLRTSGMCSRILSGRNGSKLSGKRWKVLKTTKSSYNHISRRS